MERRIRLEKKRSSYFIGIIFEWERKRNESYLNYNIERTARILNENVDALKLEVENYIFDILKKKYENRLETKHSTLEQIEGDIYVDSVLENVEIRLQSMIDIWEKKYPSSVPNKNELQKLTDDEQNVHTRVVNRQTKKYMDIIKMIDVPKGQRTADEIITVWLSESEMPWSKVQPVFNDMMTWGRTGTIFSKDDYLYRKVLRSLWTLIKTHTGDVYKELVKRLWEECLDSVGVCGQGHISRLANVLVGFDSRFISPQSVMERFQQQISEISEKDIGMEEKISEATTIMDQIEMPPEERQAWLDAF
jgi:hypothetical protein